jgi:hypothetical protein
MSVTVMLIFISIKIRQIDRGIILIDHIYKQYIMAPHLAS